MLKSYIPAAFSLASLPNTIKFVDLSHNEKSYRAGDELYTEFDVIKMKENITNGMKRKEEKRKHKKWNENKRKEK